MLFICYYNSQVKTTQPRRYLVRPNQGLLAPGTNETIQIILVEKDKLSLMQTFQRLGQVGLDNTKDKFLIQTCFASPELVSEYSSKGYEALTTLWNQISSSSVQVGNKKLQVKHVVKDMEEPDAGVSGQRATTKLDDMSHAELLAETENLRKKYDQLVSFSVNLTAERDILNNSLEQTKRDLQAARSGRAPLPKAQQKSASSGGFSFLVVLLLAILFFIAGIRLEQAGLAASLRQIPTVGFLFGAEDEGPHNEL